jgi:hydroxymethylbilane synthase
VLAQAGLERLGRAGDITEILDAEWMLPAVGQGALGLECRTSDQVTRDILKKLNDPATHHAVCAERAMLRGLGGGCQVPIGAQTKISAKTLCLRGVVLPPDGSRRVEGEISGPLQEAERLGLQVAEELLRHGAADLLKGE